jgi:enoyl-CoA hydratase
MPEVKLGIPSVVEAALLPALVGWGRTRQMLLLGQTFDAHEALAWSFVEPVVPVDQLDEATEIWVDQILSISQRAMRLQKALIRSWEDLPLRAAVQAGIDSFERAFETDELAKAMAEFLAAQATRKGEA